MSASLPGNRDLPVSQYDLSTYIGRVKHAIDLTDPRYFFSSSFFHVYYTCIQLNAEFFFHFRSYPRLKMLSGRLAAPSLQGQAASSAPSSS